MKPQQTHRLQRIADKLLPLNTRLHDIFFRNKPHTPLYTLTPDSNLKGNKYYVRRLRKFICTKDVKNIALTGDYGVGKSSVIGSFRKSIFSRTRKTRIISLLTLREAIDKDNKNGNGEDDNDNDTKHNGDDKHGDNKDNTSEETIRKNIQRELFRQLYYGERPGALYLSRYSRIGKFPILIYGALTIITALLLNLNLSWLGINIDGIRPETIINYNRPNIIIIVSACLSLALIIQLLTTRLGKFIQNISIMGIGASGFSLSLTKENPDFEQAADEFIYYFKKTGCRILILEDLDRFKNPRIYEELRQLNTIINGAKHIHRKVVFIYALKDSLISDPEARTKLFDAIVPIVPFITQDNVLQKISKIFHQSDFVEPEITGVCKVLARNIKDMRTIKAICNTAAVMRDMIVGADTGLRIAEIVAIATIREMNPSEYESLRKGESKLDNLYKECLEHKEKETTNLATKIKNRENIPDNILRPVQEEFWQIISQPLDSDANYIFSSAQYNSNPFTKELADAKFWLNFIKQRSINLDSIYNYYSNTKQQTRTISIENVVQKSQKISDLINLLSYDANHYRSELESLLKQDVFKKIKEIDSYHEDKVDIIQELILIGAIDESYKLYLSPLSDISGSVELRTFRIEHLSNRTADYDFKLSDDDIESLLNDADLIDLKSPAFYNHCVIKWLIAQNDKRLNIILEEGQKTPEQFLKFFDHECCRYEKVLSEKYNHTIIKGDLLSYIENDYILRLTQEIAKFLPAELILLLSGTTNLRDTVGKETIFITAVLSMLDPVNIKLPSENKNIIGSFLSYYEDTIIANGGGLNLARLRVANNLPTKRLDLYCDDENTVSILISNLMFDLNNHSLPKVSSDIIIQKLEKDGLTSETLDSIMKNKSSSSKIIKYCLERPDICNSLTNQATNNKLVQLSCKYKLKLQKEQLMELVGILSDENIVDLMLVSDLLWHDYEEIFAKLHKPYSRIQLGKRPLLPNNARNQLLIRKLKEFGVICSESAKKSGANRLIMRQQPLTATTPDLNR